MKRWIVALCAVWGCAQALAATVEEDVQRYIAVFSGDPAAHEKAVESLAWMGLSDPVLFDRLEKMTLAEYSSAHWNRRDQTRVGHYVRALGFSGQAKYLPTLQKVQEDKFHQRVAKAAQEDLAVYSRWNPIISNRATFDPKYSDDVNRALNMLRSDDIMLKRLAAKRVFFELREPVLAELIARDLKAGYPKVDGSTEDAYSWMVKALARVDRAAYMPLFEEVRNNVRNRKLNDYANRAIRGEL